MRNINLLVGILGIILLLGQVNATPPSCSLAVDSNLVDVGETINVTVHDNENNGAWSTPKYVEVTVMPKVTAMSPLGCRVTDTGCLGNETCVFSISSDTNAHAESCSESNYDWDVCCSIAGDTLSVDIQDGDCKQDGVISLSGTTNAHLEEYPSQYYTNDVCLSAYNGRIDCNYRDDKCDSDYGCVASISDSTNAHVGDCSAYSRKICCSYVPYSIPDLVITAIWNVGDRIYYNISNQGDADAGESYSSLYVDGSDTKTCSQVPSLSAGDTSEHSFNYEWKCSGDNDTIEVCADNCYVMGDLVNESNENNNCMEITVECPTTTTSTTTTSTTTTTIPTGQALNVTLNTTSMYAGTTYNVLVTVTNQSSGANVSGANVSASGAGITAVSALTVNGTATLAMTPTEAGTIIVTVNKSGYLGAVGDTTITVSLHTFTSVTPSITEMIVNTLHDITVTVLAAMEGVLVTLTGCGVTGVSTSGTTNASGIATFTNITANVTGNITVTASKDYYSNKTAIISVVTTTTTITSTTTTTIAGCVTGEKPPDCDGKVDDFELLAYINDWVAGSVSDFELLEAIDNWAKTG